MVDICGQFQMGASNYEDPECSGPVFKPQVSGMESRFFFSWVSYHFPEFYSHALK